MWHMKKVIVSYTSNSERTVFWQQNDVMSIILYIKLNLLKCLRVSERTKESRLKQTRINDTHKYSVRCVFVQCDTHLY